MEEEEVCMCQEIRRLAFLCAGKILHEKIDKEIGAVVKAPWVPKITILEPVSQEASESDWCMRFSVLFFQKSRLCSERICSGLCVVKVLVLLLAAFLVTCKDVRVLYMLQWFDACIAEQEAHRPVAGGGCQGHQCLWARQPSDPQGRFSLEWDQKYFFQGQEGEISICPVWM